MGYKKSKTYKPESTDLAVTPPQREWSPDQIAARLNKHAASIEKATADARVPTISNDTDKPADLASFGFNEKTSR